ncbi:glucan endo-1,3-beta-glucosidase 8-like [Phoenix dactylifera]|uniref:Glucan endo-1,3-beta-glucosidase 8-like n=1 Tax=Phoenix dactylifera TaxID=42345 RepID=A0A8B7C7T8_PHODC|nr:glucan endo-1,3-beta-glucosidase 8-like [Phoenix dactylifera]
MEPPRRRTMIWVLCAALVASAASTEAIGVNWGTQTSHPMPPKIVVQMLKDNGIQKVKLFDAESSVMSALANTGIEVMVAIPNDQLEQMGTYSNAKAWVHENVTGYRDVNIKYVAVGNEPFLKSYNGTFLKATFPALKNIQKALDEMGSKQIKATVPMNADIYSSPEDNSVPSAGDFRSDIRDLMVEIARFLSSNGSPFVINIYPFLSLYENPNFPADFAFFDGGGRSINDKGTKYTNVFDANFDTLVWALKKAGISSMKIIVGEVGWPTDGSKNADVAGAKRFYDGLMKKMASNTGTPVRPGPMDVYLFAFIDEDMKSIQPGYFERHWGIFTYDGKPKFPMDLSGKGNGKYLAGASGVEYLSDEWCVYDPSARNQEAVPRSMDFACSNGDCTALMGSSPCSKLDRSGRVSYAFNMYFQMKDQDVRACDFQGLAKITSRNASRDGCLFPIQIVNAAGRSPAELGLLMLPWIAVLLFL